MHYQFPIIEDISQVREAIAGCDDFIEVDKGDYIVFNYLLHGPDTFPPIYSESDIYSVRNAIRRECRGLVFNKEGYVIARRYHKFFNAGEKPETALDKIDLSRPHVILEKLDGSMITPIPIYEQGVVRLWWGTKMGITDVAFPVTAFSQQNRQYYKFALAMFTDGFTPIFEWCSRHNRIVIDHSQDRLVLTAIREDRTGQYIPYNEMQKIGGSHGVEVVKAYEHQGDLNSLIAYIRALDDKEGFVIRFDDGHMIKVKSDWYCKVHQAKDMLSDERKALTLILEEKLDDLLPILLDEDRERIVKYQKQFVEQLIVWVDAFYYMGKEWRSKYDRKSFAIDYVGKMNFRYNGILYYVFSCDNRKDIYDYFVRTIQATLGRRAKFEELKQQFFSTLQYVEGTEQ